ncbi:hypothetical protein D9756_010606 [Leucocoprinus leucothites]|uniref:Protein kinase domain-containing protein n=1 Tax=Leucocoprinus leucothites TaxID=201217 RepID=A0A8H5CTM8_9AGAR|nr:hypothetical protein D9756_010606 [Leucoagaricus leucothites]
MEGIYEIPAGSIVLESSIGGGGFSDVYSGRWTKFDKTEQVAVKVFRHLLNEDDPEILKKLKKRLNSEVSTWKRALSHHHPNVLPFFGVYLRDTTRLPALVSPLRQAGDILHYTTSRNTTPDRRRLVIGIATGLDHLHNNGVVHGDLTPRNVLIYIDPETGNAIPQIADFGRAKILDGTGVAGSLIFNCRYSAPEVLRSSDDERSQETNAVLSKHSDVWSLGMVLLHVLSGLEPYPKLKSEAQIIIALYRKQEPEPKDHQMANCPVGPKVWPLLQQCWKIHELPTARCSARDCLVAFENNFCGVLRQPSEDELEEAIGSPLDQSLSTNGFQSAFK